MIIDSLKEAPRYSALHPLFPRAFAALSRPDLASLAPGRHPLEGDRLYLVIASGEGAGPGGAVLEAHRKYIDIQMVIEGTDLIGWKPLEGCGVIRAPYDEQKDVILFGEKPLVWTPVGGKSFAVYFPGDAHAPMGGTGRMLRAIMKIGI